MEAADESALHATVAKLEAAGLAHKLWIEQPGRCVGRVWDVQVG